MDKVEYKIRADEIKALIGEGKYVEAVRIADTIDWKKVRSVQMLCTISDLYKINRRYEESRDVLLMAYDRHPTGRAIVYSLCELAIKMGEFVQAVEYYKEFVRIAPRDTGRYILQYKLYEAQEVSLEERIAVLEEFKKHDYRERWAYELAYLYHRVGLTTECIEECDEIFLWFGEGRYVMKALELKALHEPLSPEQQDRYNRYKAKTGGAVNPAIVAEQDTVGKDEGNTQQIKSPTKEMPPITDEVLKTYNFARGSAEDTKVMQAEENQQNEQEIPVEKEPLPVPEETREYSAVTADADGIKYPNITEIKEPSVDISDYNTLNLQETLAEGLKEIFFDTQTMEIPSAPQMGIDIKYGGNGPILGEAKYDEPGEDYVDEYQEQPEDTKEEQQQIPLVNEDARKEEKQPASKPVFGTGVYEEKPLEDEVPGAVIHPNASYQMPSLFESILSQESDGQISMAVQPEPEVEQQITGQISIAEYMENWELFKKNQQEQQLERVKKRVADETGDMFADFDEQTKAGLQEKIEKAITDALKKEQFDKASGRGDWTLNREDVINAAVDEVIDKEDVDDTRYDDVVYDEPGEENQEENPVEELPAEEASQEVKEEILPEETDQEPEEDEDIPAEENPQEPEEDTFPEETDQEPEKEEEIPKETTGKPLGETQELLRELQLSGKEEDKASKEEKDVPEVPVSKETKPEHRRHIGNRELEERVRTMTPEEKELFGPYIHHKKSRRQIINAIDNLSMDAFTGNAIVTGEEGAGTVNLAKGLIKAMQVSDSNFSGKVAKITANTLNKKSTSGIFEKLANGALIIQRAADLAPETVSELLSILQEENKGLILVMEDTKEDMDKFLDKNPSLKQSFNVRVDIEALDDDSLVAYAKQYAFEKEYAIDNLGILALHTRISERQTLDHEVTVAEVKDIVDDAIYYAEKRSIGHFADVILNKRYDENDMVILREKDFMH